LGMSKKENCLGCDRVGKVLRTAKPLDVTEGENRKNRATMQEGGSSERDLRNITQSRQKKPFSRGVSAVSERNPNIFLGGDSQGEIKGGFGVRVVDGPSKSDPWEIRGGVSSKKNEKKGY